RPLAAVLALGSGACALLAAVMLVLPELRQLRATSEEEAPAAKADTKGEEKTLAPRFDTSAPVPEGQVREQHETLQGISILMVESEPSGATVTVDGVKQGTSPVSFTPICNPGNPLRVKLVRKGFETLEHTTVCREDTMTQLSARLRKARGGR
ncbi:PEGA domain-containing protein, partial [Pyxidicoccus sp. 3LFB2]